MNTVNAAELTNEQIMELAASRGLVVKAPSASTKVEKTPEQYFLEAVGKLVEVRDGSLNLLPRAPESEAEVLFDALALKARTTSEKIAAAARPPVTGRKRGPKPKEVTETAAA